MEHDTSLLPFIERSSCLLTYMDISTGTIAPNDLLDLIYTVPSLVHLQLRASRGENIDFERQKAHAFLKHLAVSAKMTCSLEQVADGSHFFLPHMESLEYEVHFEFPWEYSPDIFGVPSSFGSTNKRPLKLFIVMQTVSSSQMILKDIVYQILELRAVGAVIEYGVLGCDVFKYLRY